MKIDGPFEKEPDMVEITEVPLSWIELVKFIKRDIDTDRRKIMSDHYENQIIISKNIRGDG